MQPRIIHQSLEAPPAPFPQSIGRPDPSAFGIHGHIPLPPETRPSLRRSVHRPEATQVSNHRIGDSKRWSIPGTLEGRVELPEHQLRRKTPKGTIDDGYDGSPARMIPGQPPFKQVIVPRISPWPATITEIENTAKLDCRPTRDAPIPVLHHFRLEGQQGLVYGQKTAHIPQAGYVPQPALPPREYQHISPSNTTTMAQTLSLEGALLGGANCPIPVNDPRPYEGQSRNISLHATLQSHAQRSSVSTCEHTGSNFHHSNNVPFRSTHLKLASLSLEASAGGMQYKEPPRSNQHRFQQKVLMQAHAVYLEVASHQNSRYSHFGKPSNRSGSLPRGFVHPHLPPSLPSSGGVHHLSGHHQPSPFMKRTAPGVHSTHAENYGSLLYEKPRGHPLLPNLTPNTPLATPQHPGSIPHPMAGQETQSLTSAARGCVEMLHHLCEQSNWSWVDGILLGGCLHYGIEDYGRALEWFSRVIKIDPRYFRHSPWVVDIYLII